VPVQTFSHKLANANASSSLPPPVLTVLKPLHTGLMNLNVGHYPIYNLAKLATQLKQGFDTAKDLVGAYHHRHNFKFITLSGDSGSTQELFYSLKLINLLAKPNAIIIMNGIYENSPALQAWYRAEDEKLITWKNQQVYTHDKDAWVQGNIISSDKCMSQVLLDIMYDYMDIKPTSDIKYYFTSLEREEELRKAYNQDRTFKVDNITTAIHGVILKCLHPNINISIAQQTEPSPSAEYTKILEFLKKYILE
jgi:hypothetical protein